MIMIYSIWEYIVILLESILFYILINKKLLVNEKYEYSQRIYQPIFLFAGSIILFIMNFQNLSIVNTVTFGIFYHLLFVLIFFTDSIFYKVIWTGIYTTYCIFSVLCAAIIPIYRLNYSLEAILKRGQYSRFIFTLLYTLFLALFILITLISSIESFHLAKSEFFVFSVIAVLCILIEQMVLISIMQTNNTTTVKTQISIYMLGFLLFFTLIFYVYRLGIIKKKNEQLIEENYYNKMSEQQLKQLTASIEELRGIKHDIQNHLSLLLSLLEKREIDEATAYINTIVKNMEQNHRLISSGNISVDCIVSNKLIIAANNKIPTDCIIHLPENLPLSNVDICSLLGNLLDNAIEACIKIYSTNKRFINLYIKPFNEMLSIKIQNSSDGIYSINKDRQLLSTKDNISNTNMHGIGIKQIRRITSKYNGMIRFTPENDIFTVEILFPLYQTDERTPDKDDR